MMVFPPLALVPDEPLYENPPQHLRNALMLVRVSLHHGELVIGPEPGVIVLIDVLGAIQARIEAALQMLEHPEPVR